MNDEQRKRPMTPKQRYVFSSGPLQEGAVGSDATPTAGRRMTSGIESLTEDEWREIDAYRMLDYFDCSNPGDRSEGLAGGAGDPARRNDGVCKEDCGVLEH